MAAQKHMTKKKSVRGGNAMQIEVSNDGPYLVAGAVPLQEQTIVSDTNGEAVGWRAGAKIETTECYALCRCGQSGNKPFCDGSHAIVEFDGTETASRQNHLDHAEMTKGPALAMADTPELCAGGRFCNAADGTWTLVEQSDKTKAARLALRQACNCPSGRLTVYKKDGTAIEPVLSPSIGIVNDEAAREQGPLWVRGGIPIKSGDGQTYEIRNRVTLCRCGKSANKPFCDANHSKG